MKSFKWMIVCSTLLTIYLLLSIMRTAKKIVMSPVEKIRSHTSIKQDSLDNVLPVLTIGLQPVLYQ